MSTKTKKIKSPTGPNLSKIHKGEVTPIKPVAGKAFIKYIMAKDSEEHHFLNKVSGGLGMAFQKMFENRFPKKQKGNPLRGVMSDEAKKWSGLTRYDPYVNIVRLHKGVHKGTLHTWSTVIRVREGSISREELCGLIQEQIDLWKFNEANK